MKTKTKVQKYESIRDISREINNRAEGSSMIKQSRNELVWFGSKTGPTRVKNMTAEHIINTRNMINRKTTNDPIWCGHHKKVWDYVLTAELQYREKLGKAFLDILEEECPNAPFFNDIRFDNSKVTV